MADLLRAPALRGGPYQFGAVLGTGGSATVYLGFDLGRKSRIPVAIKRLSPAHAGDRRYAAMLAREAHILSSLVHANIARVLDFGPQDGELLLVMEYVDGISCGKLMNLLDERGSRFPLPVTLGIADAVLAALEHVHAATDSRGEPLGLVHRDVAPGNVLIGRLGECKLSDFGIARLSGEAISPEPGNITGKLGYMSPEQASGRELDHRSDLFSFGVMLSEMLLMCRFFPGAAAEVLRAVRRGDLTTLDLARDRLPLELRLLLATAMALEPAERFASAGELRRALRAHAEHEGVQLAGPVQIAGWLAGLDLWPAKSGLRARVDLADCDAAALGELTARRRP
jgi:eukaryotic-like serine/threonine-protein kinase